MRIAGAISLIGSVAAMALFLLDPDMPVVVLAYAALGIVFASRIPANQVAGLRIPDEVRASAFGVLAGIMLAAQGLAAVLGGVVADRIGVRMACIVFLVPAIAVSIYSVVAPPTDSGATGAAARDDGRSNTAIPSASRGSAKR
jgi:predicted MFS family arabinose efflux permease